MMVIAGQDVSINNPRYQSHTGARKSGWNLPAVNCSSSLAKVLAQEITVLFCYTWICLKGTGLTLGIFCFLLSWRPLATQV